MGLVLYFVSVISSDYPRTLSLHFKWYNFFMKVDTLANEYLVGVEETLLTECRSLALRFWFDLSHVLTSSNNCFIIVGFKAIDQPGQ